MKEMIDPLGNKAVYKYNDNSNITSLDGIGIDGKSHTQNFDYDSLNRLTHHKIQKETGFITTQYGYNPAGYLESVITPNGHGWSITRSGSGLPKIITDPIGNKDDHSYDHRGWLKSVIETEAGGRQLSHSFTNNVIGNQVFNGDSINRNYDYVFDHDKQVIKHVRDPQGGLISYEFDGLNRLKKQIRHIDFEGVVTDAGTACKYDANGNLEQIIDADGNITRYAYDDKDRLTDIFYPDTGDQSVHFTYNGNEKLGKIRDRYFIC